ncbi:UNVERIFIED_CONTAM: hypothetical protein FKN15_025830 [Acipenser sinensis]
MDSKNKKKIQFSVPVTIPSQLDPHAVEMRFRGWSSLTCSLWVPTPPWRSPWSWGEEEEEEEGEDREDSSSDRDSEVDTGSLAETQPHSETELNTGHEGQASQGSEVNTGHEDQASQGSEVRRQEEPTPKTAPPEEERERAEKEEML